METGEASDITLDDSLYTTLYNKSLDRQLAGMADLFGGELATGWKIEDKDRGAVRGAVPVIEKLEAMKMAETMKGLKRTHYCGELREESDAGKEITVCGWVQRQRDLGQLIFVDLRDRTGMVQLAFDETTAREVFEKAAFGVRSEYVLAAQGKVRVRLLGKPKPRHPHRRCGNCCGGAAHPEQSGNPALRDRGGLSHCGGHPPEISVSGPAAAGSAAQPADASPHRQGHQGLLRFPGLYRNRNPHDDQVHPGRRPGFSGALPGASRAILRPAPVPPDVQAAFHGGGL